MSYKNKFTMAVKYDHETQDYYIPLPDSLLDDLGWKIGDEINWKDNGDGSFTLSNKRLDENKGKTGRDVMIEKMKERCGSYETKGAFIDGWTEAEEYYKWKK